MKNTEYTDAFEEQDDADQKILYASDIRIVSLLQKEDTSFSGLFNMQSCTSLCMKWLSLGFKHGLCELLRWSVVCDRVRYTSYDSPIENQSKISQCIDASELHNQPTWSEKGGRDLYTLLRFSVYEGARIDPKNLLWQTQKVVNKRFLHKLKQKTSSFWLILEKFRSISAFFRSKSAILRIFWTVPDFWAQSPISPESP